MDTRKFLLVLTVVIAVYVTVSSATQNPSEEHDTKAVQLADDSKTATSERSGDDSQSPEGKSKSKPKRKHHGKNKNHRNNHARPRSHGGRNRTRGHHNKKQRHGSKDKSKHPSGTPLPQEETSVKPTTGENGRQERNHKKEKNNKNRSRSREGRNRNHNHNDGNHPVQNDASTSLNDPVQAATIYQAQNYNHNLVGHSTKTTVKHEPTKATGVSASH